MERELSGAAPTRRARGPRGQAAVGLGAVLLLRGVGAALAAGRERECRMAKALAVVADDAAQPRLRLAGRVQGHVAVRRGLCRRRVAAPRLEEGEAAVVVVFLCVLLLTLFYAPECISLRVERERESRLLC